MTANSNVKKLIQSKVLENIRAMQFFCVAEKISLNHYIEMANAAPTFIKKKNIVATHVPTVWFVRYIFYYLNVQAPVPEVLVPLIITEEAADLSPPTPRRRGLRRRGRRSKKLREGAQSPEKEFKGLDEPGETQVRLKLPYLSKL